MASAARLGRGGPLRRLLGQDFRPEGPASGRSRRSCPPLSTKESSTENRGNLLQENSQPFARADSRCFPRCHRRIMVPPANRWHLDFRGAGPSRSVSQAAVVGVVLVEGWTVSVFCSHAARSASRPNADVFLHVRDAHALVDQSQQAQFLARAECYLKHKWLATH